MKISWLTQTLDDLDYAVDWVSDYDLDAAIRLDEKVEKLVGRLEQFPHTGKPGRVDGTREAVLGNYILVYAINGNQITIMRFLHGAMRYP